MVKLKGIWELESFEVKKTELKNYRKSATKKHQCIHMVNVQFFKIENVSLFSTLSHLFSSFLSYLSV